MTLKMQELWGSEAKQFFEELADMRIRVFREYPYLYEGAVEYEQKYLKRYFDCPRSFVTLCWDGQKLAGATTSIPALDEIEDLRKPLLARGVALENLMYFGESMLLPKHRGKGLGKEFFKRRLAAAKSLGMTRATFCAVSRPEAQVPAEYRDPSHLWKKQGFAVNPEITAEFGWRDLGSEEDTKKKMVFWFKDL